MENWNALFNSLEISGDSNFVCEDKDIDLFEKKTEFALPNNFKEYCKVFGSGVHSREFSIYCPCEDGGKWDLLTYGTWQLTALKDAVEFEINHSLKGFPAANYDKMRWLEDLLNHSFPFASNGFAESFIWDFNSYRESDKSYDIYRVGIDSLEEAALVGRNFYKFITEFIYEHRIDGKPLKGHHYPKIVKLFSRAKSFES